MVHVRIPTQLRAHTDGNGTLEVAGHTVGEIISALGAQYPSLTDAILDSSGALHRFVNAYVNDDDVRYIGGLDSVVGDGDVVTLIPAVAGGC